MDRPVPALIKNTQVLLCPSAPQRKYNYNAYRYTNYNANAVVFVYGSTVTNAISIPLTVFSDSTTMFALDGGGNSVSLAWCDLYYSRLADDPSITFSETGNYSIATRHLGGANVAFLDGHVKWIPQQKIYLKYDGTLIPKVNSVYNSTYWYYYGSKIPPSIRYTAP